MSNTQEQQDLHSKAFCESQESILKLLKGFSVSVAKDLLAAVERQIDYCSTVDPEMSIEKTLEIRTCLQA